MIQRKMLWSSKGCSCSTFTKYSYILYRMADWTRGIFDTSVGYHDIYCVEYEHPNISLDVFGCDKVPLQIAIQSQGALLDGVKVKGWKDGQGCFAILCKLSCRNPEDVFVAMEDKLYEVSKIRRPKHTKVKIITKTTQQNNWYWFEYCADMIPHKNKTLIYF